MLNLEEMEKIFALYHTDPFFKAKSILRDNNSCLPTLKERSLHFTCYDDTVYESVQDGLTKEYLSQIKENKKWMYKKGKATAK